MTTGIYKIYNKITNQIYYGSSVKIQTRISKHFSLLETNKHDNKFLQNSFNKYKREAFAYEIVELCSKENLLIREQFYIDSIFDNGIMCYNLNPKSNNTAGRKLSEETLNKIRKNRKKGKEHPLWGKKRPKEIGELISKKLKGKIYSKETIEKMRKVKLGKKLGPRSEETKNKIRQTKIGNKNPMFGKKSSLAIKVQQFNKELVFIAEYDSLTIAEKLTQISFKSISACINGKQKTAGGYVWKKI